LAAETTAASNVVDLRARLQAALYPQGNAPAGTGGAAGANPALAPPAVPATGNTVNVNQTPWFDAGTGQAVPAPGAAPAATNAPSPVAAVPAAPAKVAAPAAKEFAKFPSRELFQRQLDVERQEMSIGARKNYSPEVKSGIKLLEQELKKVQEKEREEFLAKERAREKEKRRAYTGANSSLDASMAAVEKQRAEEIAKQRAALQKALDDGKKK
jgi:hypothetical protein